MSFSASAGAGKAQLQDRHGGGVVIQDQRRSDAGRHLLQHRLGDRGHLGGGGADIHIGMEEYLDDADAGQRLAFDMVDVVHRQRKLALIIIDDAARHIVGRQAAIGPGRRDHRNFDVGENVDRRADGRQSAEEDDQDRHHDEGVRPPQRQTNNCEHGSGNL